MGSARHVFFPVHKIGFCLSQKGELVVGVKWELCSTFQFLLFGFLFFCFSFFFFFFGISFASQIVFSVRVGRDAISGSLFFGVTNFWIMGIHPSDYLETILPRQGVGN